MKAEAKTKVKLKFYKPHEAQKKIHLSNARFKVICCGRRFGKSQFSANEALKIIKKAIKKGKQTRGWIVAPTFALTNEVERYLRPLIEPILIKEYKQERRFILQGGNEIEIRSADSDNLVGAGLDWLIVDEAARVRESVWSECLRPTLTDKLGKAIIISTPRGKNWFYDHFQRGQDRQEWPEYESWQLPTSANPYISKDEIAKAKKELAEVLFSQEYLAQFLDDANSFFRNIEACIKPTDTLTVVEKTKYECPKCDHPFILRPDVGMIFKCPLCGEQMRRDVSKEPAYYIGIDLAKSNDFTVICVVRYSPYSKTLRLVDFDRFNQISWTIQKERIKAMYEKWHGTCYMDATGVGDPIVEDIQQSGIPTVGVKFTNTSKSDMVNRLAVMFEREMIEIPNEKVLVEELKIFESTQTPGGLWRYEAPEGKHDDCVISLALAVKEAANPLFNEVGEK